MKHAIATIILSLGVIGPAHAGCDADAVIIGARYQVTTQPEDQSDPVSKPFILWRHGDRVAHERPDVGITDLWERMSDGRLRLVRHFDEHERGIEYQPGEVGSESAPSAWSRKRQLISESVLDSMVPGGARGKGCERVQAYSLEKDGSLLSLEWLPELSLVKRFSTETSGVRRTWTLREILMDQDDVREALARRDAYQMTDYADIGDNESDPFLLKMMNLGHISRGHSDFYDAEGNPLEASADHEH